MVRNATLKLVYRSDPTDADHDSELYDLAADPYENANVYGDDAYARQRLALTIEALNWLVQTSDITPYSVCERGTGVCSPAEPFRR